MIKISMNTCSNECCRLRTFLLFTDDIRYNMSKYLPMAIDRDTDINNTIRHRIDPGGKRWLIHDLINILKKCLITIAKYLPS